MPTSTTLLLPSLLKAGQVIDGFTLVDELHRTGLSRVWLAKDPQDTTVVIKAANWTGPTSMDLSAEAITQEAVALDLLTEAMVPQLIRMTRVDGLPALVLEHIAGDTLGQLQSAHGSLASSAVIEIAFDVVLGLSYIHGHGVVHRDIKPDNVIWTPAGTAVIIDFGISDTPDGPLKISEGMFAGSPGYVAPEQILGSGASPASDMFSLGATLFTLCMGYGPYPERTSLPEIAIQVQAGKSVIQPLANTVPPGLSGFISRCLRLDPTQRPTAIEAAGLLEAMLSH